MNNKLSSIVLAGTIAGSTLLAGPLAAFAQEPAEVPNDVQVVQTMDEIEKEIRGLQGINDQEKQVLIDLEKSLEPTWKEVLELENQVVAIYDSVYAGVDDNEELSNEDYIALDQKAREASKEPQKKLDALYDILDAAYSKHHYILKKIVGDNPFGVEQESNFTCQ